MLTTLVQRKNSVTTNELKNNDQQDLKIMDLTWDVAEELAQDHEEWHSCIAQ